MKKKYLLIFFILSTLEIVAQSRYSVFINSGYSFNNSIAVNNEKVKNSKGYVITFGGNLKLFSIKNKYLLFGIAGKTIFASGCINDKHFKASTLRLVLPLKMIFPLTKKWTALTGFNFQNNVDFGNPDLSFSYKYSLRVDYSIGVKYLLTKDLSLTSSMDFNLRNIPDPFFINDPKFAILIGIEKQFQKKTKK